VPLQAGENDTVQEANSCSWTIWKRTISVPTEKGKTMYKSPIDIIYGQMETQMEGAILKAIQKVDVNVDKDELLRALQYDRGQYDKGYADGKVDAMPKWISVTERLPENDTYVNVATDGVVAQAYWHNDKFYAFTAIGVATVGGVTHWMPLPQPPKGE
jgi:hypothetical protein